jgi:hypothetical protein
MRTLQQFGLTPEQISRHVVRVEAPLTEVQIEKMLQGSKECNRRRRAEFVAAGLTTMGTPRKRKPNTANQ